jgi:hypothetical protein
MDEKTWDEVINEGATDGYNPYRKNDSDDGEPAWSKIEEKIAKIQRIMNATSNSDSEYPRLQAKKAALEAAYNDLKTK